jgi:hypothetical protein
MNPREFLAKRKAHLIFGGAFLLFLAFNIITGFTSGQTILGAAWKGLSTLRPIDYIMFALFWYACAVHRPNRDSYSPLISLNLSRTNSEK